MASSRPPDQPYELCEKCCEWISGDRDHLARHQRSSQCHSPVERVEHLGRVVAQSINYLGRFEVGYGAMVDVAKTHVPVINGIHCGCCKCKDRRCRSFGPNYIDSVGKVAVYVRLPVYDAAIRTKVAPVPLVNKCRH
ncbi:hypothetical protein F441_09783 [Phytophthora nicotianae CJ01A1]|uniref:Uncharacterized protein n=2 Tax=Phytophthora nicotianae TaxID=4792 RepID=W2X0S1_PHYNI|nr:hypothetical protein L916_09538 [Phytophthora nicotianae]ETP15469.1 hypothetical protein F441_09783 [Phytophthora nicotianae CJ01A1]